MCAWKASFDVWLLVVCCCPFSTAGAGTCTRMILMGHAALYVAISRQTLSTVSPNISTISANITTVSRLDLLGQHAARLLNNARDVCSTCLSLRAVSLPPCRVYLVYTGQYKNLRGVSSGYLAPSPTLSPTDPVPRGLLTLCPAAY